MVADQQPIGRIIKESAISYVDEKFNAERESPLQSLVKRGQLPAEKIGGIWLIARSALATFTYRSPGRPSKKDEKTK